MDFTHEDTINLLKMNKDEIYEFLLYCSKNNKIDLWNNKIARYFKFKKRNILIDLSEVNLIGANLIGVNLIGVNLIGVNLSKAYLIGANLSKAYLIGANLKRADLTAANLKGADLVAVNLTGANLTGADLTGADLTGADLTAVDLKEVIGLRNKNNVINDIENRVKVEELNEKIRTLENNNQIKNEETKKLEKKYNDEKNQLLKQIEEQTKKKENESAIIEKVINSLNKAPRNIANKKDEIQKRIKFFNRIGLISFFISLVFAVCYIINLFDFIHSSYNISFTRYMAMIFPIIFPIVVAFMSYRQSNIKEKELKGIDEHYIYIHNIDSSLQALNHLNSGEEFINKAQSVVDRLIDKTLSKVVKESDTEKEFDLTPDTVEKIVKTLKNSKDMTT
jgi:uncharacterized protein YjbI with pentapeptide repeats